MALLEVDRVTKRFGGLSAVSDASVSAEEGKITALIGPNGAGKTTLFNVITGFEQASSGRVVFDGQEVHGKKPWQVARMGMARTFQTPVGFRSLSVWDNLMVSGAGDRAESFVRGVLGRRAWGSAMEPVEERAEAVLTTLGLWERRHRLIEDLGAGEQKLVEFARQLVNEPRMLLLDEPASGVDPVAIGKLRELILSLKARGISILVIDHNLSFILSIADTVYVLAAGTVIAEGAPTEVARDPRVIEIYLGNPKAHAGEEEAA
jgi:ABC-type branched-subunit amino acid transport system ATPase component